ncbi:unnamed protein product [Caretta caretta]
MVLCLHYSIHKYNHEKMPVPGIFLQPTKEEIWPSESLPHYLHIHSANAISRKRIGIAYDTLTMQRSVNSAVLFKTHTMAGIYWSAVETLKQRHRLALAKKNHPLVTTPE